MVENFSCIDKYFQNLSTDKNEFLDQLRVTPTQIHNVEVETREQAKNPAWFQQRVNRFTASKNNTYRSKNPKTVKGFE